ncbi:hypothetical protein [Oceanihabitans sediminis]|uniref:hypothetical protein n=1 Tax=Oceanihabitans sediminis TaxID=1812012 RepID=UPI00299D947D|nr:hypothetical protein [Oceanihabitans sediminis]MDX1279467.1 hypothetical protein [Oceanihabitans sediminis]
MNTVRINTHNTLEHETAKLKVAYLLIKDKKKILTETIFKNGARADILIPEDFRVIEILHSETEKEVLDKKEYYPHQLDILYFKSSEVLKEDFEV